MLFFYCRRGLILWALRPLRTQPSLLASQKSPDLYVRLSWTIIATINTMFYLQYTSLNHIPGYVTQLNLGAQCQSMLGVTNKCPLTSSDLLEARYNEYTKQVPVRDCASSLIPAHCASSRVFLDVRRRLWPELAWRSALFCVPLAV
jgi:hypothetical protein